MPRTRVAGVEEVEDGGVVVETIAAGLGADREGTLRVGDRVVAVNGAELRGCSNGEALAAIQAASSAGAMRLLVARNARRSSLASQGSSAFGALTDTPESAAAAHEYAVEVLPGPDGLGLSLAPGHRGGVVVQRVLAGGPSAATGEIGVGDVLVEVGGRDVRSLPARDVAALLRGGGGDTKVVPVAYGGDALGVQLAGGQGNQPIVVESAEPGGAGYRGGLRAGMEVLAIDKTPLRGQGLTQALGLASRSRIRATMRGTPSEFTVTAAPAPVRLVLRRQRADTSLLLPEEPRELERLLLAERQGRLEAERRAGRTAAAAAEAESVERDYDEIVTLLEAEVAHLRGQLLSGPDARDAELVNARQRCVVLGAQLNKAIAAKQTTDVALRRLLELARNSIARLERAKRQPAVPVLGIKPHRPSNGPPPPRGAWAVGDSCQAPCGRLGLVDALHSDTALVRFAGEPAELVAVASLRPVPSHTFAVAGHEEPSDADFFLSATEQGILMQTRETLRAVELLLEDQSLPFGWEEAVTVDGSKYYIDHAAQVTSWKHPISERVTT